jgi:hypothetical protein
MNRFATKPSLAAALALALALAGPAAAQNSSEPAPAPSSTPKVEPAPPIEPASSPSPSSTVTVEPAQPVIVTPQVQTAPPPPPVTTIQPDIAYPNGFADPADPFANDLALRYQQREGFPWGLLGLLGLLGLIPLLRDGRRRTVYVERDDDEPRRVVRRERIEDTEV